MSHRARSPASPRGLALALAWTLAFLPLAGCAGDLDPAARPTSSTTTRPTDAAPVEGPAIRLDAWLDGFDMPLLYTVDAEGVAYVVEQGGRILRLDGEDRHEVLDITSEVRCCGEQGLLGLAFDPADGRAYLSYTDTQGDSILERWHADGARERLLRVDQPYGNHNGGHLAFGPDGHLHFGLGDGGSAGDPQGNGQDIGALLGSILRLDVSGETGVAYPEDNPYGTYVWAKGLRNPWRFTFDRETGDLYVADVGQNMIEEVNFVPSGTTGELNFGWSVYEGTERYALTGEVRGEHTPPVAEYTHDDGCSVTGGYVYRGDAYPELEGLYFFGDYCSGKVWALREKAGIWRMVEMLDTELAISSFGQDAQGELYVVDHGGLIYKLVGTGARLPDVLRP